MLNHLGTETIETERLILRQYVISDKDDMFHNWVTDSEVCKWWTWEPHKSMDITEQLLSVWVCEYNNLSCYHWVIICRENNQAIGYVYLNDINETDLTANINYLVSRKYWNRGIATEASRAVLEFSFKKIGFETINSRHHEDNPASGKVMIKLGFSFVCSKYNVYPECERINGNYNNYTITKENYLRT